MLHESEIDSTFYFEYTNHYTEQGVYYELRTLTHGSTMDVL